MTTLSNLNELLQYFYLKKYYNSYLLAISQFCVAYFEYMNNKFNDSSVTPCKGFTLTTSETNSPPYPYNRNRYLQTTLCGYKSSTFHIS